MQKTLLFIALLMLILSGCRQEPANPVEGAWNLIYARQVADGNIIDSYPDIHQGSQVKMWSDNYWMFIGKDIKDSVVLEKFGGGSYTLEGIVYKETIEYHYLDDYVGETLRMRIVVSNDTLVQVWPADETGEIDQHNYTSEKYVKVK